MQVVACDRYSSKEKNDTYFMDIERSTEALHFEIDFEPKIEYENSIKQ